MKIFRGFTLIELMITVAVVAILAAIAFPSYQEQIRKTRRTDGKSKLLELVQREERFYTQNNTYTTNFTQLFNGASSSVTATTAMSDNGYYQITVVAGVSGGVSTIANGFTLTATPQAPQNSDAKCLNLTLTSTNVKNASGPLGPSCW